MKEILFYIILRTTLVNVTSPLEVVGGWWLVQHIQDSALL